MRKTTIISLITQQARQLNENSQEQSAAPPNRIHYNCEQRRNVSLG